MKRVRRQGNERSRGTRKGEGAEDGKCKGLGDSGEKRERKKDKKRKQRKDQKEEKDGWGREEERRRGDA